MSLQKLAHAELRVTDLDVEIAFLTEVIGLQIMHRDGDRVFFGCGYDRNVDLVIRGGGTGVESFAVQVDSEDDLEHYTRRLEEAGVAVNRMSEPIPDVEAAIEFALPSGHRMELVLQREREQALLHPALTKAKKGYGGINPIDLDHITLRVENIKELSEFLASTLDFCISEAVQSSPGVWSGAWTRVGDQHHDVAMRQKRPGADETLDHLCWTLTSFEHLKVASDYFAQAGFRTETGPGRHGVGGNLYSYIWGPGGNRYEMTAEMARLVSRTAPTKIWTDLSGTFSAWGDTPPESFSRGS
ncbi:VOC family protein [Glaciibacter sp. 2TAF33]|uniref:VOC family protein n=1 Tax=Glaciibacter sp. 2TAF33 TaxID=3233015 RepID=UPI003F919C81